MASSAHVDAGVTLVSETSRSLDVIVKRVGEIETLVTNISTSTKQQASGLQQLNIAVAEVDAVTQQNAALVEETTAETRNLAEEAVIADLDERGAAVVISQHPRRIGARKIEPAIYVWRHLIENFFCKLKEFKRNSMRACQTNRSFEAMIYLAAALINSR